MVVNTGADGPLGEPGRFRLKLEPAVVGTEVDAVSLVHRRRGSIGCLDLHPTNGIQGVAAPATEPLTVAIGPIENGEKADEHDVQVRRVVPLEVCGGDLCRARCRHDTGNGKDPLRDESRQRHHAPEDREHP